MRAMKPAPPVTRTGLPGTDGRDDILHDNRAPAERVGHLRGSWEEPHQPSVARKFNRAPSTPRKMDGCRVRAKVTERVTVCCQVRPFLCLKKEGEEEEKGTSLLGPRTSASCCLSEFSRKDSLRPVRIQNFLPTGSNLPNLRHHHGILLSFFYQYCCSIQLGFLVGT